MKFFIDTEFLEGKQDITFLGCKLWKTKPTIDLISIGIISEDDRKYYSISKDFNINEAWNRYDEDILGQNKLVSIEGEILGDVMHYSQINEDVLDWKIAHPGYKEYERGSIQKVYWIRDNVLNPIFFEFIQKELNIKEIQKHQNIDYFVNTDFTKRNFKRLLKKYGKTNFSIANEIQEFCTYYTVYHNDISLPSDKYHGLDDNYKFLYSKKIEDISPEFYAYYADYDWVVFCQLFGYMMDLPYNFPMYCQDIKQLMDNIVMNPSGLVAKKFSNKTYLLKEGLNYLKGLSGYPKQENEHNALADAKWNKKLYNFLVRL